MLFRSWYQSILSIQDSLHCLTAPCAVGPASPLPPVDGHVLSGAHPVLDRQFRPDSLAHCFRVAGPPYEPYQIGAAVWWDFLRELAWLYGQFATDVASPGAGGSSEPRCGPLPAVYASGIMIRV